MSKNEQFNFLDAYFPEDFKRRLSEQELDVKLKRKIKRNWKSYAFLINGLIAIIGFILGYIGFYIDHMSNPIDQNPANIAFQVLRLYVLQEEVPVNASLPIHVAKFFCPLSLTYFAVLTLITVFQENFRKFRLQFFKNHFVVFGLNKWTSELIKTIRLKDKQIVVIIRNKDNEYKPKIQDLGVIVLTGNFTDEIMLNSPKIHKAKYLIAFTEEDSKNMEIAINTQKMMQKKKSRKEKLKCFIHINDRHLYNSFSKHDIFREKYKNLEMNIFNNYTNDARVLFLSSPFETEIEKGDIVHLLIIGFGHLGESVLLQAVRMGHYADDKGIKITVLDTVSDDKNEVLGEHFLYHYPAINCRYPGIDNIRNCEESFDLNFIEVNFENLKDVQNKVISINEEQDITAIIICLEDETKAVKFGVDLITILMKLELEIGSEEEPERIPIKVHFPIRVYLDETEDIFKLPKTYTISPFGLIKSTCSREIVLNELLDKLAIAIHNDYKQNQEKEGKTEADNPNLVEWERLRPDIKDSNRYQADHIPIKLRALSNIKIIKENEKEGKPFHGFTDTEKEILARMEHNRWCAEKWIVGWKRSQTRDDEKKLHNLLIPFDKLNEDDQKKDYDNIEKIPDLLKILELKLVRID